MEKYLHIYGDGKEVSVPAVSDPIEGMIVSREIEDVIKNDVIKWLVQSQDPVFNIYLQGPGIPTFQFKRSIINIKTSRNSWIQYCIAVCEHWDEIISFRVCNLIDNNQIEDGVCRNEVISESYGMDCIPLGYKK